MWEYVLLNAHYWYTYIQSHTESAPQKSNFTMETILCNYLRLQALKEQTAHSDCQSPLMMLILCAELQRIIIMNLFQLHSNEVGKLCYISFTLYIYTVPWLYVCICPPQCLQYVVCFNGTSGVSVEKIRNISSINASLALLPTRGLPWESCPNPNKMGSKAEIKEWIFNI